MANKKLDKNAINAFKVSSALPILITSSAPKKHAAPVVGIESKNENFAASYL